MVSGQIQLQKAHGAFDIHAYRAGINVRGRDQHATDRRSVTSMAIGIEHQISYPRRTAGIDGLLQTGGVKPGSNRFGADDRYR